MAQEARKTRPGAKVEGTKGKNMQGREKKNVPLVRGIRGACWDGKDKLSARTISRGKSTRDYSHHLGLVGFKEEGGRRTRKGRGT